MLSEWISVVLQIDLLNESIIHPKIFVNFVATYYRNCATCRKSCSEVCLEHIKQRKTVRTLSQTLSASNTIWDISSRDLTSAIPIKKECIFFGATQCGLKQHASSQVSRSHYIWGGKNLGGNEKQVRKDKLCSLGGRWALFVPVEYCRMMFWWPFLIRWCFILVKTKYWKLWAILDEIHREYHPHV